MYYDRKEGTMQTNAPPLLAISMVMVVHMSNTDGIAQCSISRANSDANGRCHRATTCSILPRQLHKTTINQYNHFTGHFDEHRDAAVQCRARQPPNRGGPGLY